MAIPIEDRRRLLEELIEHSAIDDVDIATMFGSPAIRHRGKVVCFLSHDAQLIVKLTREDTLGLIGEGRAEPVVMGARTLREWVSVPRLDDDRAALEHWTPHVLTALGYARANASSPVTPAGGRSGGGPRRSG
ncbi:hypothetical protein SAMN06295885_2503 [Rathayibacter oskolensis]|uniref:TfoX N-terminal domain-containing protein n=1 Tax=Rathayibacter oskolensis TaxID=1891671 RepID=A0A1X7P3H4_9MICO|nr:hypothetical protein [Rathayibacter oskolensis]SMH45234.1 hypothetical protein SAMN06295885_2503 [Rathayibacter oskolensis]